MPKGISDKITFKPYDQSQQWLIPPSIDELVPEPHLVRVVSETIDELNLEDILKKYTKGGGASRFHPVMMLKVLIYGYMSGVYSSRHLARACRENVLFMWLAGGQKPDFRTINTFRSEKLNGVIQEVLVTTAKMLETKGYIKLENYFVDGTKIESASGKYTFVWKKATDTNERRMDDKIRAFVAAINHVSEEENNEYGERDLEELGEQATFTSEDLKTLVSTLNDRLASLEESAENKPVKKKLKKEIKLVEKDFLVRKEKYEQYRKQFNGRNSFSKTDPEATFMRMKEDHMLNGQLKPGYNIQVGCENGFVVGYDIFPNPTDTRTLIPHLENMKKRFGKLPKEIIADAGYGSEENYAYLERENVEATIKYTLWQKEQSRSWKKNQWNTENWKFDEVCDSYECPAGKQLSYSHNRINKTASGFRQNLRIYTCQDCGTCELRSECTRSQEGRSIQRNEAMIRLKQQARERLASDIGKKLMRRRAHEVETVFGQLKANQGFRRFRTRGIDKVSVEWGLLVLGFNMKRLIGIEGK